ncbi:hypothetical protein [Paenibacillus elgii]|uniref:hypothetical protein n=1 Tax=Paenibacillus elgii TaxID=189691 RepID=UPI000248CB6B|nr:hypothetical protein [Paenibacillus elgii]
MGNKDWTGIPGTEYDVLKKLKRTNKRWKKQPIYEDKKNYYHRDPLHSEVEVYDKHGDHVGVMTPEGEWHPKKGRDPKKNIRKELR